MNWQEMIAIKGLMDDIDVASQKIITYFSRQLEDFCGNQNRDFSRRVIHFEELEKPPTYSFIFEVEVENNQVRTTLFHSLGIPCVAYFLLAYNYMV